MVIDRMELACTRWVCVSFGGSHCFSAKATHATPWCVCACVRVCECDPHRLCAHWNCLCSFEAIFVLWTGAANR